jgi:acetoin utilization deacetylase AcuC-like enzyme
MIVFHHEDCTSYSFPGHPERPQRVSETEKHLRATMPELDWRKPEPAIDEDLLRTHSSAHLARLREPRHFDGDTPFFDNIADVARLSAGGALAASELALKGERAFSLMRPPGHHASTGQAMGFCYLNSIAVAAIKAVKNGVNRVAVWDFDAHHGNGTEEIFYERPGLLYVSVHQYPGYPGTGAFSDENCLNFPVPPGTPAEGHMTILEKAWGAVVDFEPELLLISAGFDAYEADPITTMCLRTSDFETLGQWLNSAGFPTAAILEGGYSNDLPLLVGSFLRGWGIER